MVFYHTQVNKPDIASALRRILILACLLLLVAGMTLPPGAEAAVESDPYQDIDLHALSAPEASERSIEGLAAYLIQPAGNDFEKARAIYRWVTANIVYDIRGFLSGQVAALTPEAVLQRRSSVCDGFASLFKALAQAAGLKSATIKGYAKGFGYLPGTGFRDPPNHAWNAIFLDNRWYLLDASMGSGYINSQRQLIRQFRPYYFLTPPEMFIYDHFPLDARWQLIDPPLSRQTFAELVWLKPHFFNHDLRLISHPKAVIATSNQAMVTLRAPDTALVLARLEVGKHRLDDRFTFVQKHAETIDIHIRLPEPGQYRLRLYVKRKGEAGKYKAALDYVIQASEGSPQNAGFPKVYAPFNEHGVYLHSPMSGYLKTGQDLSFKLEVPGAEKVAVVMGAKWLYLTRTDIAFEGNIPIPKGVFGVYALFPGTDKFHGLLEYTGL